MSSYIQRLLPFLPDHIVIPDHVLNPPSTSSTAEKPREDTNDTKQTTALGAVKRYTFDFEQTDWKKKPINSPLARKALQKIEEERTNIEKDMEWLETIRQMKSKQEGLMSALLKIKNELKKQIDSECIMIPD